MRFRRRDHERYIGGYDPEHEMPDPDRRPRGPWQSEAYRDNARDSRWPYRWNPDRFEERTDDWRRRDRDDFIQPRDRYMPYAMTRAWERDRYLGRDRDWDYGYPPRRFDDRDYRDYRDYGYYSDPWARHDRFERDELRDDWDERGYWDRDRPGRGWR
jgi:hypothetical protein